MLCFDGERVGSPPFESLARQKHCYYEKGGRGGVAGRLDIVVPAQIQKKGAGSRAGVNGYSIKSPTSPPLPPATDRTVISS